MDASHEHRAPQSEVTPSPTTESSVLITGLWPIGQKRIGTSRMVSGSSASSRRWAGRILHFHHYVSIYVISIILCMPVYAFQFPETPNIENFGQQGPSVIVCDKTSTRRDIGMYACIMLWHNSILILPKFIYLMIFHFSNLHIIIPPSFPIYITVTS